MNANVLATLLSFSVAPAAVIAIYKFRQCSANYLPFLICVILALLNEIVSTFLNYWHIGNSLNANIYVLLEYWLLLWLFYRWHKNKNPWMYLVFGAGLAIEWCIETYWLNGLSQFSVIFRALYAFIMVLLSSGQLSYLLVNQQDIHTRPRLILCLAFLMQFSYKTFFELFFAFNIAFSTPFYRKFLLIWGIVNAISNIIYIPALLCIPQKKRYYITFS